MIRSLDDLVAKTREWAREPDGLEEDELRSPGLSAAELRRLTTALPGMPASYLDCLARFDLRYASLGYLQLGPGRPGWADDLVQTLIEVNDPAEHLYRRYLEPNELYSVASWEADPICVARDLPDRAGGEVIGIEMVGVAEPRRYRMAPSFPVALLAAGSVMEALDDPALAGPDGLDRFLSDLAELGLDEEQRESWRYLIGTPEP
jgi:hypothetical protein